MVYAWLIRVGHDLYELKGITPVQEGFGGVYVDSQSCEENGKVGGRSR